MTRRSGPKAAPATTAAKRVVTSDRTTAVREASARAAAIDRLAAYAADGLLDLEVFLWAAQGHARRAELHLLGAS